MAGCQSQDVHFLFQCRLEAKMAKKCRKTFKTALSTGLVHSCLDCQKKEPRQKVKADQKSLYFHTAICTICCHEEFCYHARLLWRKHSPSSKNLLNVECFPINFEYWGQEMCTCGSWYAAGATFQQAPAMTHQLWSSSPSN